MSDSKERISLLISATRVVFYYGFIPTVLILGFKKGADEGNPPLNLLRFHINCYRACQSGLLFSGDLACCGSKMSWRNQKTVNNLTDGVQWT